MEAPPRELHLFFAAENSRAVILYRAKSDLHRLIAWDTKKDIFEPGQWLKARVYASESALSPDGKHFLYSALDGRWAGPTSGCYVAVSKPPHFTAIEFFPVMDTYGVGGFFINNQKISLRCFATESGVSTLSSGLQLDRSSKHWEHLRTADDWEVTPTKEIGRLRLMTAARNGQDPELAAGYHCEGAKLFRKTASGNHLLKDFGDMGFEAIKAPYQGVQRRETL